MMEANHFLIAVVLFIAFLLAKCSAPEAPILEVTEGTQAGDRTGWKAYEYQPEGGKTA